MKQYLFFLLAFSGALSLSAQKQEPYQFKEVKTLTATPVKSQDQTGTCWAFSTASFLESEVLRLGKGEVNLSEMFVVRQMYHQKCENYVRRQGDARFGEGGLAHDVLNAVRRYGVVPENEYPGRKDLSKPYNHSRLERDLKTLCDGFVKRGKEGKLTGNWLGRVDSLLDAEFGVLPVKFTVNNTVFTPTSYRDFLGLNPDDYINITSFSHHPFYEPFVLEIPDNWAYGTFYNLPIAEMMRSLNYSIQHGYTVEWDADVSNRGFSAQNGIAIVPEKEWKDKNTAEQNGTFKLYEPEQNVTQEYRQLRFDEQETQDDHLMHITGVVDEGHSGTYYMVKNSWGQISDLKGYVYVSDAYMRLNTLSFTVHKDALPADVRKRLNFDTGSETGLKQRPRQGEELKSAPGQPAPQGNGFSRLRPVERSSKATPAKGAKESDQ